MSASVKWWHFAIAGVLVVVFVVGLWRLNTAERPLNVDANVAKGTNADNALTIDMNGGH